MKSVSLSRSNGILLLVILAMLVSAGEGRAQRFPRRPPPKPGPMLADGYLQFQTPALDLKLVRSSQTVAALDPKAASGFDFTPGDRLVARSQNGFYQLGDIDLRLRTGNSGAWRSFSTALARQPVKALPAAKGELAAANLAPTLPPDIPLAITRIWTVENGKLALRFVLKNKTNHPVEIGSLGIPMIFNNILSGRTLEQAYAKCSFYDPYIGEDAGYLQVTPLRGVGPVLLIVPDGRTPFEAYKPILNPAGYRFREWKPEVFKDLTPRSNTFEGFYDWMVYSLAYAQDQWKNAEPWNPPTALTLAPGETKTYGLKFLVAPSVREIDNTLAANARPVAVGVPGYVLPTDMNVKLFLKYPEKIASMKVEPREAISIRHDGTRPGGWKTFTLRGKTWGRSRLTIAYANGLVQTINYFTIKPEAEAVADMGHFLTTKQWFVDPKDPFHRSPSPMSYDRETNQIVTQDSRVWIAGLSDEGGAGSWLATIMKEFGEPNPEEIAKFEEFVDGVMWGQLQYKDGPKQFGVKKSLFFYQPDLLPAGYYRSDIDWHSWTSWNRKAASAVDRSYDYPHVASAYWVLYRLARDHQGLVTDHSWQWYLNQAYETSMAMTRYAPYYAQFGQMEGDIFLDILKSLQREGMTEQAQTLEAAMRKRADIWRDKAYPFGSEMPWDSTGQEEVYAWMRYFGFRNKAEVTLNAILGYDPTIPNWGYNGSARRYWDFIYAGETRRLERQLHHYGSSINALPLLAEYRRHPNDFYLLRVGYGGITGPLTNIDQEGFASCAFHAFPDMLKFDSYSGDYGTNFFGVAMAEATYIVDHPEFGWLAFGGNLRAKGGRVEVTPLDAFRRRVYVAPYGLWLKLDAGKFREVEIDAKTGAVRVEMDPATRYTHAAILRVEQPAQLPSVGKYRPARTLKVERGAYDVPLAGKPTWIELTPQK
jgi:Family of unknown function (DUF5695)